LACRRAQPPSAEGGSREARLLIGVLLIVGSYFLVQIGRMSAVQLPYILLNGLGALCILLSLYYDFNMSAVLVEIIWLLISLLGAGRILLQRRRQANLAQPNQH
jgi:hypothetical protein